jgi:class 3 adenylate cyclase
MSHVQSMRLRSAQDELARRAATQAALADRLARYLPPAVHRAAFDGAAGAGDPAAAAPTTAAAPVRDARPRRAWLTVCFADLAGFTALTDAAESEEVVAMLDDFYTAMAEAALAHGGTLDKFIGDAVMVFFGAPASAGRAADARACVAMATEMQARFDALRRRWRRAGIVRDLALRVGVHSGWCTVGDFGHGARVAWTVIGGAVNTASRLEAAARPGQVLVSRATWLLLGDDAPPCRRCPPLRAKGLPRPVDVFELAPDAAAAVDLEIDGLRVRLAPSEVDARAAASELRRLARMLEQVASTARSERAGSGPPARVA